MIIVYIKKKESSQISNLTTKNIKELNNEYKLKLYDRQDYTEMVSVGPNGAKPIIAVCRDSREQKWYILNELARIDKKESVAIISRGRDYKKAETSLCPQSSI